MQRDCPSKCTYVAAADGGYVSASDTEDEEIAATNITGDHDDHAMSDEEVLGASATANYRTMIVHRVLSAQVEPDDMM